MSTPSRRRPAQRHRHPADPGHARAPSPRPRWATTCSATTPRCRRSSSASRPWPARRRRSTCPAARWATSSPCTAHRARRRGAARARVAHLHLRAGRARPRSRAASRTPLAGTRGALDPAAVAAAIRDARRARRARRACCASRTRTTAPAGRSLPLDALARDGRGGARARLRVHLDGARLWNASVATGVPIARLGGAGRHRDDVLLQGTGRAGGLDPARARRLVRRARRFRKRWGGGMRQVGHPGRGVPARARPPRRAPGRGPPPRARRLAAGVRRAAGVRVAPARHQHRHRRARGPGAGPGRGAAPRWRRGACAWCRSAPGGCAPSPTSTSTTPASSGDRRVPGGGRRGLSSGRARSPRGTVAAHRAARRLAPVGRAARAGRREWLRAPPTPAVLAVRPAALAAGSGGRARRKSRVTDEPPPRRGRCTWWPRRSATSRTSRSARCASSARWISWRPRTRATRGGCSTTSASRVPVVEPVRAQRAHAHPGAGAEARRRARPSPW